MDTYSPPGFDNKHIGIPVPTEVAHEIKPDTARTEGLTDIDESMDEDTTKPERSANPSPMRPVTNNTDETNYTLGGKSQRSAEQLALKTSLDRLKRQLAAKDKENKGLNRALAELKTEMLSMVSRQEKVTTDTTKEVENRDLKQKLEDTESKLLKVRKELKRLKDMDEDNNKEIQELRAEIGRKDSTIVRLKQDKLKLEKEVENAESRMSHLRESIKLKLHETETKELRKKISTLEESLQSIRHTSAEKPLDTKEGRSQEVSRWEESKKLQQQMDKMKEKLTTKTRDNEDKQRLITRLNEAVSRLEREKLSLETELKSVSKRMTSGEDSTGLRSPQRTTPERPNSAMKENIRILQDQNRRLTEELAELRQKREINGNEDDLKLENSYLQEKVEILETRLKTMITAEERRQTTIEENRVENANDQQSSGGNQEYLQISPKFPQCAISKRFEPDGKSPNELITMVLVLKKTVDMLYEENRVIREKSNTDVVVRLRHQLALLRENMAKLEEENEELREDMDEQPRVGNIGTINRLHEAVDQLEAEKRALLEELEQLKFRQQNGPDQSDVEKILRENRDLKEKLRRNAPRVAWAEQLTSDSSRTAANKLALENEKLRKDLKKEQSECDRLKKTLREMNVTNEKLQDDLVKFQSIAANKRKWQPNGVGKLYEHKNKELDEDIKRLTAKSKQLEDTLKAEIQKYHREATECRRLKEKVAAFEWKPKKDPSVDETTRTIRDLKAKIADITADNLSLKTELEIVERQLKPAWQSTGDMDMNVVKERLKLYDKLLQESVELKLECNSLRSQLNPK